MIQEIINYKNVLNLLEELIEKSPYKKNYIINKVGISSPTFYRKLRNNSFTPDEALRIVRLIDPKEGYMHDLEEGLKRAKDDLKNGRTFTTKEVLEEIRSGLK